jgi:hypothetical protein
MRVGGACGPPPPVAAPLVPRCALLPAATPRLISCLGQFDGSVPAMALGLLVVGLVACGGPAAAPTSPPAPAATVTATTVAGPSATPTRLTVPSSGRAASSSPEPTALPREVENAYLSNVDDLIAEAADLVVTPCDELTSVTQANPNLLPSVRGFASALKRVGTTQPALDTDAVRSSLADLDHSMGELEGALSRCGIK